MAISWCSMPGWTPPESVVRLRNVESRGFVPNTRLISVLRDEVDVLVLPMSFDPLERINMELSFPSKLTDYTATCLPILVWAPPTALSQDG